MTALSDVDLALRPGVFTVISGPSGSGKTSLISVLGALIAPDSGAVLFEDSDITKLAPDRRSTFRREKVGYIFQSFRLMPALNAEENIRLSLEIRRVDNTQQRALRALEIVGLAAKAHLRPDQMSSARRARCCVLSTDRKSTRLNSSHLGISYAVFCLKKKTKK